MAATTANNNTATSITAEQSLFASTACDEPFGGWAEEE